MKNWIDIIGIGIAISYVGHLTWILLHLYFLGEVRVHEFSRTIAGIEVILGIICLAYLIKLLTEEANGRI